MSKNTIKLVHAGNTLSDNSLDMVVNINGKDYSFAIRFLVDSDEKEHLTILKSPELWHVKTDVFGYPSD